MAWLAAAGWRWTGRCGVASGAAPASTVDKEIGDSPRTFGAGFQAVDQRQSDPSAAGIALVGDTREVKRRQRPQSFKMLQDRFGNPARVSTDKNASHGTGEPTPQEPRGELPGVTGGPKHG